MEAAVDHNCTGGARLLACPGCAQQLRGEIGVTPVSLRCPHCGLRFLARCTGLDGDRFVQLRLSDAPVGGHYQLLGLAADADGAAIKAAYRREALRWHPDRNGNSEVSVRRFRAIAQAYAVLSDRQQRAAYDAELASQDFGQGPEQAGWRRWAAVREPSGLDPAAYRSMAASMAPRPARPWVFGLPWQRLVLRWLAIGLAAGVLVGLLLPRGGRPLQLLFGGVALAGLVRLALRLRRPAAP